MHNLSQITQAKKLPQIDYGTPNIRIPRKENMGGANTVTRTSTDFYKDMEFLRESTTKPAVMKRQDLINRSAKKNGTLE